MPMLKSSSKFLISLNRCFDRLIVLRNVAVSTIFLHKGTHATLISPNNMRTYNLLQYFYVISFIFENFTTKLIMCMVYKTQLVSLYLFFSYFKDLIGLFQNKRTKTPLF